MSRTTNRWDAPKNGNAIPRGLAVAYTRVSTAGQGSKGTSSQNQRDAIEEFARVAGYKVIETFDDVASGAHAKSFYNRPELQNALDSAVRNDCVLIVWDWDRLSRHAGFDKQVRKVFSDLSRIVCARHGMDMQEASRKAQFLHSAKAREIISNNTKRGMARMSAQGVTFGNPDIQTKVQPMGTAAYSNMRQELEIKMADVLRRLPNPMGITRAQAAEIFNQHGLRTLQNKEWTKSRVTEPLKRARAILEEEEKAKMAANPKFGIF
ncbi:hypothetical protein FIU85_08970 [Roseovarius sp. THAF8]|uniref:recombinase family protein n=1 Tax=Roseovarius sp. THAF8 TaxID=2587846 RepID=UPI0012687238|nr:recombinase family protein [Roseovarius sp. THAF8]QFT97430.1 hypothetical protein FIU85_08970 [Roseovarius sp. THAF8]